MGLPANTRHRLSTRPTLRPPSRPSAPSPAPPVIPAPLPSAADSDPTGSRAGSTPRSSLAALPKATLLLPEFARPAVRTTLPHALRSHTQPNSHARAAAPALLPLHSATVHPTLAALYSQSSRPASYRSDSEFAAQQQPGTAHCHSYNAATARLQALRTASMDS